MLSRTASSLYWLGRYVERADFLARLLEATVRLDALSSRPVGEVAWSSALKVSDAEEAFGTTGHPLTQACVVAFLAIDQSHPASIARCLDMARSNAKAVRTGLNREAWTAINRAWLLFERPAATDSTAAVLALVEAVKNETRGFEGAVQRMLRSQPTWFIRLGQAVERADATARLLDVKYHILLPQGEQVGGLVDRDQWTTILQTVSAVTAYRWLYSEGLRPGDVIELLIARPELPRSLAASAQETVEVLRSLSQHPCHEGEASALAHARVARMALTQTSDVILLGLHEYLRDFVRENEELHEAIGRQFKFG